MPFDQITLPSDTLRWTDSSASPWLMTYSRSPTTAGVEYPPPTSFTARAVSALSGPLLEQARLLGNAVPVGPAPLRPVGGSGHRADEKEDAQDGGGEAARRVMFAPVEVV